MKRNYFLKNISEKGSIILYILQISLREGSLIFISASAVKSCSMLIWLKYMK